MDQDDTTTRTKPEKKKNTISDVSDKIRSGSFALAAQMGPLCACVVLAEIVIICGMNETMNFGHSETSADMTQLSIEELMSREVL